MTDSLPAPAPPANPNGRLPALDVVRGVAVLGIVIANIPGLGQPLVAAVWPGAFLSPPGPFAEWLWGAQLVLVDGKMRGLFTLLFGAGMVLFLRGAEAREAGSGPGLLARRLGWLALFGLLHWALLWRGDILLPYAVAGLLMLGFAGWSWRRQLALGLAGYTAGALVNFVALVPLATGVLRPPSDLDGGEAAMLVEARREAALIAGGDYAGSVRYALEEQLPTLPLDLAFGLLETAPLMLIGMGLIGAGLFDGRIGARRQVRAGAWLWLAGALASVPVAMWAIERGIGYWVSFAAIMGWLPLTQLAGALGLAAMLAVWGARPGGALKNRLAEAGRCAFTNYIATSALALALFSGWGLGLYGKLSRIELYALVPLFWLAMLAWPRWWLARFRHGPLEWAWRSLTYWRVVPFRR